MAMGILAMEIEGTTKIADVSVLIIPNHVFNLVYMELVEQNFKVVGKVYENVYFRRTVFIVLQTAILIIVHTDGKENFEPKEKVV